MLVLTRKTAQKIQVGENITITVLRVKGGTVKLGIDAPREVRVLRSELPVEERETGETANTMENMPAGNAANSQASESSLVKEAELPAPIVRRLVSPERRRNELPVGACPSPARASLRAMVAATRRKSCTTL